MGGPQAYRIEEDDLGRGEVVALLTDHLAALSELSPPESMHALDADALRAPSVTFWTAWDGDELLGCGALKELDALHGEIKSMRTAPAHLRKGVAARMVEHLLAEAKRRGYERVSLETGSSEDFTPAHALYSRFGFEECAHFGDYQQDPNSRFMTRVF